MDYEFFLFTCLVQDLIIKSKSLTIPYDRQYDLIVDSFAGYKRADYQGDYTYEAQVQWIGSDIRLRDMLIDSGE